MKPHIGVLPLFEKDHENLWINHMYFDGVLAAGGLPFLLPLAQEQEDMDTLCQRFDGFIFTGGQDVDPALYGEEKIPQCSYQAPRRDSQELYMLKRLLEMDKPVLGICRGVQMMNVACGGTMYQDIPTQLGNEIDHAQMEKAEFDKPFHYVSVLPNTRLHKAMGSDRIMVNSMHHQGVKDVPPCLTISAKSDDGLVEAIEHNSASFYLGVQWHPEFLWKGYDHQLELFRLLTQAAGGR